MAATEREYLITVSAVLGRSTAASLGDFVKQAQQAKAKVDAIFAEPSKGATKSVPTDPRLMSAKQAAAELARIRQKENDEIERDAAKAIRAEEKKQKYISAIKERYFREEQRRGEQADAQRQKRNEQIVSGSLNNMRRAIGAGARVAGELTSGFGVSFDLSSAMQRGGAVDETARKATISGFGAQDKNATAADVQATIDVIHKAGDASKQAYGEMAAGLEDFVSKSSDLDTGKKVLADLGRIARATGTDVKDLVSAAGDVNKTLDDTPDKAEKLLDIMTLVATQSAKGSVEVKDFAKYMGRVTAGAFKFEGDKGANIGILAALAQVSMKGGNAGAREATNSAQAFSQDITKGKALKRFEDAGIKIFTDDSKTTLRSPEKIITDFLRKSQGSLADVSKLFQNKASGAVVTGFSSIYTAAGGGEAGIKAVQEEFKKFAETMSADDIKKRFELSAEGRAAKAQDFQNKLDTIADSLATRVLPAFEKLAPDALDAAKGLASIVAAAASNPALAITAAIVASIGKAAIGTVISEAVKSNIAGAGIAGGILALGVIALTAEKVIFDAKDEADTRTRTADLQADEAETIAKGAKKTGMVTAEDRSKFDAELLALQERIKAAKQAGLDKAMGVNPEIQALKNWIVGGKDLAGINAAREDATRIPELEKRAAELQSQKETVQSAKTVDVEELKSAAAALAKAGKEAAAALAGVKAPSGTVPQ